MGFAAGQSRVYRQQVTLTAASGPIIGLKTRTVNAVVDRPSNVAESNETNNSNSSYKFCDDV